MSQVRANPPQFEFGCSTLPFSALDYWILTRQGRYLEALLRGTASPQSSSEAHFIRCVCADADYDSHQCPEADAWRQWMERRAFEARHPAPGPKRSWVRTVELRAGMICYRGETPVLLERVSSRPQHGGRLERGNPASLPWRCVEAGGSSQAPAHLPTGAWSEIFFEDGGLHQVADGLDQVMALAWRDDQDGDLLVVDPETGQTYSLPANRVSLDACEPGKLQPDQPIRVQWWEGKPIWAWGPR